MEKCDFYKYYNGYDCCILKDKIPGQDSCRINSDFYKDFCRYSDSYKKCPFYAEYKKL